MSKRRSKPACGTITIHPYGRYVRVAVHKDLERSARALFGKKYVRYVKKTDGKRWFQDAKAMVATNGKTLGVLLRPDSDLNTIAHEAFHVVERLAATVGIPHNKRRFGDEAWAYLVGFMVEHLHELHRELSK